MNRTTYNKARKLIRNNGAYALRWMDEGACRAMFALRNAAPDKLAERSDFVGAYTQQVRPQILLQILRA